MNRRHFALLAFALSAGCASPRHLQYDHGRAYMDTFTAQADRTRPSASSADHALQGVEAASIRQNVTESTTDQESAQVTLSSKSN